MQPVNDSLDLEVMRYSGDYIFNIRGNRSSHDVVLLKV